MRGRALELEPDAPPLARCKWHLTDLQSEIVQVVGWVGIDLQLSRYVWSPLEWMPNFQASGRIIGEVLSGPELGTVDGAMLCPLGGRDRLVLSR